LEGLQLVRGEQFINSLDDGRSVWLEGAKLTNLPEHPAFKGFAGCLIFSMTR
jgi:aromatic ring hydroxylase